MRILYITMDNPAVETILGGMHDETLSGLPAFYYPFKMLLARGCTIRPSRKRSWRAHISGARI